MFPNLSPGTIGIRTGLAESVALAARHGWAGCDLPAVEAAKLAAERSAEDVAAIFSQAGVRPGGWGLPINWREPYDQAALDALVLVEDTGRACGADQPSLLSGELRWYPIRAKVLAHAALVFADPAEALTP